jgi:hypothetical protein
MAIRVSQIVSMPAVSLGVPRRPLARRVGQPGPGAEEDEEAQLGERYRRQPHRRQRAPDDLRRSARRQYWQQPQPDRREDGTHAGTAADHRREGQDALDEQPRGGQRIAGAREHRSRW